MKVLLGGPSERYGPGECGKLGDGGMEALRLKGMRMEGDRRKKADGDSGGVFFFRSCSLIITLDCELSRTPPFRRYNTTR
jgi:hypothetical protein